MTTHAAADIAASRPARVDVGRPALWAARIVGGLAVAFLLFDATGKLLQPAAVVEGTVRLGYEVTVLSGLGLIQIACLALYLVPRTAVLGGVLWTAYLGGAVASHVRVGDPLFTHVLFPVYVAVVLWGALWLRDRRLRALLPLRSGDTPESDRLPEGGGA